ncbi:MAG: hypothetical protein HRT36_06380, partial [Alphaproteobacteria bacterium]|nr:hypothetical protein [Alphaproteobacteria bacterium]
MTYSLDFRQKVLSVRERDNPTFQQVANRFSVGIASVANGRKILRSRHTFVSRRAR